MAISRLPQLLTLCLSSTAPPASAPPSSSQIRAAADPLGLHSPAGESCSAVSAPRHLPPLSQCHAQGASMPRGPVMVWVVRRLAPCSLCFRAHSHALQCSAWVLSSKHAACLPAKMHCITVQLCHAQAQRSCKSQERAPPSKGANGSTAQNGSRGGAGLPLPIIAHVRLHLHAKPPSAAAKLIAKAKLAGTHPLAGITRRAASG